MGNKILISCIQYPPKGGASVLAYHTIKLLRGLPNNHQVKGLFINPSKVNCDPENLGNIFLLQASTKVFPKDDDIIKIKNQIEWQTPDIILAYHHYAPTVSKALYPDCKVIYITATCTPYNRYYLSKGVDYNSALNLSQKSIDLVRNSHYSKLEIKDIKSSHTTVCNSYHTKNLFNKFYATTDSNIKAKISNKIFDSSGILDVNYMSQQKTFDIIVIASDFQRPPKNSSFLFNELLSNIPNLTKCIIGKNADKYTKLENCTYKGFIPYSQVQECMKQSKILLTPSLYESGGNVAREALNNGCKVLMSNCCAFCENYSDKYVCTSFTTKEWTSKIETLLETDFNNQVSLYDLLEL